MNFEIGFFSSSLFLVADNVAPIAITSFGDVVTIPVIVLIVQLVLGRASWLVQLLIMLLVGCYFLKLVLFDMCGAQHREQFLDVVRQRIPVLFSCMVKNSREYQHTLFVVLKKTLASCFRFSLAWFSNR